jgi:hypothetical protein
MHLATGSRAHWLQPKQVQKEDVHTSSTISNHQKRAPCPHLLLSLLVAKGRWLLEREEHRTRICCCPRSASMKLPFVNSFGPKTKFR